MNTEVVRLQEGVSERRTPAQLLEKLRSQRKSGTGWRPPSWVVYLRGPWSQLYFAETRQ